jgi:hypothetical protein
VKRIVEEDRFMHLNRALLVGAAIVFLGISAIMPATAQTSPIENFGFVRFIHTAVDVPPLDIYVGDTSLLISSLSYGESTDFMTMPTSVQGFTARAAGSGVSGSILARLNRRVKANQSEIITAAGLNSKRAFVLEPLVLVRNATRGRARVRVFNTVWGGPYLTVKDSRGVTYGQDLQYLSTSPDSDVEPGTYQFEIQQSGSGTTVAMTEDLQLEVDKIYSLMIIGGMDGTPPVRFVVLITDQETTRVRIANNSSAPADIYIKGNTTPFARGIAPGAVSEYTTVPSGATTFILRAPGSAPNSQELAFVAPQLRPGRDVTITINGSGVATQMGVTDDHLTPSLAMPTMAATLSATSSK